MLWLRLLQRALLPAVVGCCAVASLAYGVKYHTVTVYLEQEVEVEPEPEIIEPLTPVFDPSAMMPMIDPMTGMPIGPDPNDPFAMMPDVVFDPMSEIPDLPDPEPIFELVPIEEPESKIVSDITIGGLNLLASGIIERTYSGEPPLLCPT